jgi:hypothetical protein
MAGSEIRLFISALFLIAFNWPFLAIFKTGAIAYLFSTWAICIALAAVLDRRERTREEKSGIRRPDGSP